MTAAAPRVLQVIAPAPFGGAESVARALGRAYPGGATLAVLLQHGGHHPFADQARAEGLDVVELVGGRRRYDREVALLTELIRERRPDVLHTHIYHADFVGWFAARKTGIPIVSHIHGITGGDWKDRTYQWLDLKLIKRFDALVCVSESVRRKVLAAGARPERLHLVTNPYSAPAAVPRAEARSRLALDGDRPVLGWIGRVNIEKGADLFVESLALMPQPRPLAVIVGAGPELAAVRADVARLGLENDVRFAGEMPDAASLLSAFDALVLSSRTEGLPMTLLEAMGAGVPVAAFAVGGIPDAVSGASAWLAPPGDLAGLAAVMRDVLDQREEAARRAAAAASIVQQRFGIQPWIAKLVEVHRQTISR